MRKHISIALSLSALSTVALAQTTAGAAAGAKADNNAFELAVSCPFLSNGDTVLLARPVGQSLQPLDTAVVNNGRLAFKGDIEGAALMFAVHVKKGQLAGGGPFVLESGHLAMTMPEEPNPPFVIGNQTNDRWNAFNDVEEAYVARMRPLVKRVQDAKEPPATIELLKDTLNLITSQRMAAVVGFITKEATTKIGDLIFQMYFPMLNDADRSTLLKLLSANNPQLPGCRGILQQLDQEARKVRSQPGAHYVDFEMADLKGKRLSLKSVVEANKYTLVDFWASWCGPCRMEMPTVKQAYKMFHVKGLEVFGVSLDSNLGAWQRAVLTLDLPWLHVSDLRGWACEAAQIYGVHSIPSCLLINQQGVIVAKDLRGQQLIDKLSELLK